MDKKTKGAWVVHHGRKISTDVRAASEYSTIDLAYKSASLLARMAESNQAILRHAEVVAAVKIGGLNPKTEMEACLAQLEANRLIQRSAHGVEVLGLSGETALSHASTLLDNNDPQSNEMAAINLAEKASEAPLSAVEAIEYIGDMHRLTKADSADFITNASEIGFVDAEGDGADRLLFNGNLFRRENAEKTKKVLASLSAGEIAKLSEFDSLLKASGYVMHSKAEAVMGSALLSKVKAAALYDMNVVSNEAGEHVFITSPASFHKFTNPMTEDAFDHAKALVSALSYGMSQSSSTRGRIWGIGLLLGKLIRGGTVGPAPAIGFDYRALEFERVVQIIDGGDGSFKMRLLKREVGEIALQVLQGGNAAATALETLPSAGMRAYTAPEVARARMRKTQTTASKTQTRNLLSAVRVGVTI
ncbi:MULTISPECIES: hypothetical protein [unclassified Methylobacterium]